MPNLAPPVVTADDARHIVSEFSPVFLKRRFPPLMTAYLTDDTDRRI